MKRKAKKKTPSKSVFFVYTDKDTKSYVQELSNLYNVPESQIINKMINCHRFGKKFSLQVNIPQYVVKAEKFKERRSQQGS